jgi:hypothetical protein
LECKTAQSYINNSQLLSSNSIFGRQLDSSWRSVSLLHDINKDGLDDIIIGDPAKD